MMTYMCHPLIPSCSPFTAVHLNQLDRLVKSAFVHRDLFHLLANMTGGDRILHPFADLISFDYIPYPSRDSRLGHSSLDPSSSTGVYFCDVIGQSN